MHSKLIVTADGSHTIFVPQLNEHYHSVNGAINESKHVYINAGLKEIHSSINPINILEAGMGTGLNVFLTFLESTYSHKYINYYAIDNSPLDKQIVKQLNYVELLKAQSFQDEFNLIHFSLPDSEVELSKKFTFKKFHGNIADVCFESKFHLVYFDMFAPSVQPGAWTEIIFKKLYETMIEDGILVTYCAKGSVKRALKNSGFFVEALQGATGKREMIRARIRSGQLAVNS